MYNLIILNFKERPVKAAPSPLLFTIAIEPLAIDYPLPPFITGIPVCKIIHKLTLFVEDMLFFLSNPSASLTHLH